MSEHQPRVTKVTIVLFLWEERFFTRESMLVYLLRNSCLVIAGFLLQILDKSTTTKL